MQLRRGHKDDTRDDWAEYEAKEDHIKPLEGELVIEYDHGIPRLKIGDGVSEFSQLPYMSIDSFVVPTSAFITLNYNNWQPAIDENGEIMPKTYCQEVVINNATVTPNSKIDLQLNASQLLQLSEIEVSLVAENDSGVITIYAVGDIPPVDCEQIQVTIKEVTTI